jgi:hypothetical protein
MSLIKQNQVIDEHFPYEGAGFLMYHEKEFVLGIRVKKPQDVIKDPTVEVEYMGGKLEKEDDNNPLKTAYNELVEEVGNDILDPDWKTRVVPIHTFQKFSKKWIWCCLLRLTKKEYDNILAADKIHHEWKNAETRDLSKITGRSAPVRKAISSFVTVDAKDLLQYIENFSKVVVTEDRMKDAKTYRENKLKITRMSSGEILELPLRAFNTVIFEEHVKKISHELNL